MEKAFACYSFSQPKPSILVAKSQVYVVFGKCFPCAILYVFYVFNYLKTAITDRLVNIGERSTIMKSAATVCITCN